MAGPTTDDTGRRRPRPEMDVELSRAASKILANEKGVVKTPTKSASGDVVKSRDLPGTPETAPETAEDDNNDDKKESSGGNIIPGAPDSVDDFIVDTAGKVGVKEDQVKSVTTKILEEIKKHSPEEVVQTISDKVPGADKYLNKIPGIPKKKKEEEENSPEEEQEEAEPEEGTAKTRAAPNLSTEQEPQQQQQDEDDDDSPPKKSCLPSCLQNLLDKATGGKTPTDLAGVMELVKKAGITPDKVKEIATKFVEFLKDKVGEDTVNKITSKVPGLNSLIKK